MVLVFIGAFLVMISSYTINAERADTSVIGFSDNFEITDNIEDTDNKDFIQILTSAIPAFTNTPIWTVTPTTTMITTNTITLTTKPTSIPTIKPTSTLRPSPTKTVTPTATKTTAPTPTPKPTVIPTTQNATCDLNYSLALFNAINTYRSQNGKLAYSYDSTVAIAACNHSYWMLTTGIFSHTGINGTTSSQRCAMVGTTCTGENITMGNDAYILPATIIIRWSGSTPHNANLLGSYTRVGIGRNGNYVTVDFGF
jgi:uncharacterized protein YkwD